MSKSSQRLRGALILLIGFAGTIWIWQAKLDEGEFNEKFALLFPFLTVVGYGLLFFPIDVDELKAKHGVDKLYRWEQYPFTWKILAVAALLVSITNLVLLNRL